MDDSRGATSVDESELVAEQEGLHAVGASLLGRIGTEELADGSPFAIVKASSRRGQHNDGRACGPARPARAPDLSARDECNASRVEGWFKQKKTCGAQLVSTRCRQYGTRVRTKSSELVESSGTFSRSMAPVEGPPPRAGVKEDVQGRPADRRLVEPAQGDEHRVAGRLPVRPAAVLPPSARTSSSRGRLPGLRGLMSLQHRPERSRLENPPMERPGDQPSFMSTVARWSSKSGVRRRVAPLGEVAGRCRPGAHRSGASRAIDEHAGRPGGFFLSTIARAKFEVGRSPPRRLSDGPRAWARPSGDIEARPTPAYSGCPGGRRHTLGSIVRAGRPGPSPSEGRHLRPCRASTARFQNGTDPATAGRGTGLQVHRGHAPRQGWAGRRDRWKTLQRRFGRLVRPARLTSLQACPVARKRLPRSLPAELSTRLLDVGHLAHRPRLRA